MFHAWSALQSGLYVQLAVGRPAIRSWTCRAACSLVSDLEQPTQHQHQTVLIHTDKHLGWYWQRSGTVSLENIACMCVTGRRSSHLSVIWSRSWQKYYNKWKSYLSCFQNPVNAKTTALNWKQVWIKCSISNKQESSWLYNPILFWRLYNGRLCQKTRHWYTY